MRFFDPESRPEGGWQARLYTIIFQTDTRAGWLFDVALLIAITLSIIVISLETLPAIDDGHRATLRGVEWVLTGLFTIEYILRLLVAKEPRRYALSVLGLIDLLSLLPTYLSLFFADAQALQIIRALRLLRVFRIFQIGKLHTEGRGLVTALLASRYKIAVFLGTVMIIVIIQGALLYYLEHAINPDFTSIPRSIYWAVVTLTTVGYGDISPVTVGGQFIASILMLLGYGIIAVPTGIVSAEVALTELRSHMQSVQTVAEHHVILPAHDPSTCAGSVPALAIVIGALHADVTTQTLTEGVRVDAEVSPASEESS